ncbi:hypothetical protein IC582_023860 [Cucumis melo]
MGQPLLPSAQPSDQKSLHAPPLSGTWAQAPSSVNLTAHPIRFYASSPVQPSHPSSHPPPHAPPIAAGQQPSELSNVYSSTNLYVDPLQQPFFYRNGADQHHNRWGIEAGESSAPSGYGQPCARGLRINLEKLTEDVLKLIPILIGQDLWLIESLLTFVWSNLDTWRSKKQGVMARSSAEAEHRTMSLGIYEEIWFQKVLSDLCKDYEVPMKLFCENKAAISIANNPIQHDMTGLNMWRLTNTLSKISLTMVTFALLTYPRANKLLISS